MSRAAAWADRDQQEKDALLDVMREQDGSVDVFRHATNSTTVGLTSEVGDPPFLRTINARLDRPKKTAIDKQPTDLQEVAEWLGQTDDADVCEGDIWRWRDVAGVLQSAQVARIVPNQAGNRVYLEAL